MFYFKYLAIFVRGLFINTNILKILSKNNACRVIFFWTRLLNIKYKKWIMFILLALIIHSTSSAKHIYPLHRQKDKCQTCWRKMLFLYRYAISQILLIGCRTFLRGISDANIYTGNNISAGQKYKKKANAWRFL